jgi:stress-induced-phosphoprotein 1
MPDSKAEAFKAEGNNFFKGGQYKEAIEKYRSACDIDPNVPAYWSNMAACYEKLNDFANMEEASRSCIKADRSFIKGYFRLATAQKNLKDLDGCTKTLESGLAVDSSNSDLKKMKKEIVEIQRNEQVVTYCNKADEQLQSGDVAGAYKTLELASRLDAGNSKILALQARVNPKYEKMEKQRKASLSGAELHKEKGDELYKNAQFEAAVAEYTKCINAKPDNELLIKALSNRAACNKQISHFDGTIEDCSAVLELDPSNVKALIRRAQAFEGVERYRFALQDVKAVLAMPYAEVGKTNFDLCNGMQHRLTRTVAQLKKMNSN